MGREKYGMRLAQGQLVHLQQLIRGRESPPRKTARAQIPLKTDEGRSVPKVADPGSSSGSGHLFGHRI